MQQAVGNGSDKGHGMADSAHRLLGHGIGLELSVAHLVHAKMMQFVLRVQCRL